MSFGIVVLAFVKDKAEFVKSYPPLFSQVPEHFPQDAISHVVLMPVCDLLDPILLKRRDASWDVEGGKDGCPLGMSLHYEGCIICHWEDRGFQKVPYLVDFWACGFEGPCQLNEAPLNANTCELLRLPWFRAILEEHKGEYVLGVREGAVSSDKFHFHGCDVGFVSGSGVWGESHMACAIREFAEETSLLLEDVVLLHQYHRLLAHIEKEDDTEGAYWEIRKTRRGKKQMYLYMVPSLTPKHPAGTLIDRCL